MLYMFLFTLLVIVASIVGMIVADKCDAEFLGGACAFTFLAGLLLAGAFAVTAVSWHGAGVKANILNSEYGTSYTQQDVFYASEVIDAVRELDRKRVEVNGDLLRDKPDKD